MADATKTVDGFFGPKQVTRAEFVAQWASHFGQTLHLCATTAEFDELEKMKKRILELAGAQWDRIPEGM
jgi:nitrate/TMAO reductase-like tetraheme cytochrome c subunit